MLSRLDDYPVHQTSEPLAHPATGDRHVYDRYWFNGYDADARFYFGVGAALYPNLGIMDCGFSVVADGVQYAFHASRRAPQEPTELEVGPFRIEIQEPMLRLKIALAENETGISAALQWIPRTANIEEGRQLLRRRVGRMEATRFNQFGFWEGEIKFGGRTLQVDPRRTYGTKDRSWGVRPVGDPAPPGAPPQTPGGICFLWAPLHWEKRCTHMGVFETPQGRPWHFDGMVCPVYSAPEKIPGVTDPAVEELAGAANELEFAPGTRRMQRAQLTLQRANGESETIALEPLLCFRMKGIGYGHPEWGHGRWKGELAIGGEQWNCADADEGALENQHIQQVVRARSGEQQGIGVLEQIILGPHARFGFTDFLGPQQRGDS